MSLIDYLPDHRTIDAEPGETILHASLRAGIPHTHACGGKARCSTCRVLVTRGLDACTARTPEEQLMADRLGFGPEIRLACQTRIAGDVALRRLVLDDEDAALVDQRKRTKSTTAVGDERRIAILFADIRGFTPFAESLPAYDIVHILNRYFTQMARVIDRFGGRIDNYMGDGLMALFGLEDADDVAMRAVTAGLCMLEAQETFKHYLRDAYARIFEIGIGIHHGEAVVGTVGAIHQQRITAIGSAVNLASRIESANKMAGTRLLISAATFAQVGSRVQCGRVIELVLPGTTGACTLHEVLALRQEGATR